MGNIRLGTIGTNFITDFFLESAKKAGGLELKAVYSRKQETGDSFSAKYGDPPVYTDLEEFFSSDIEAVYIASPNFLHYAQAKQALLHGKHVLLEKPACMCEKEFLELSEIADEKGLVLLEAMRPGHDPGMEKIRAAIPRIGTVRRAVFDFCQYSTRYDKFREGTVLHAFDPKYGNAAIMDIGCYAIHVCVMLFGAPQKVTASCIRLSNGFEGQGTLLLTYPEFTAEVIYSKITESFAPSMICGEDGTISIGKLSLLPWAAVTMRGGKTEPLFGDPDEENRSYLLGRGGNMVYEAADFVKCIKGELPQDKFRENTRRTLHVMDEVLRQNEIVF